ncbi:MAG: hypothetical protein M1820_000690 [Bogoriella megaspora]|nr:MAG: hypothetical protein M1820_000690 [Bogoriella megaspora]
MLPKFLYGSYKRYKADTSAFVDWLIETAKKCGYDAKVHEASQVDGKPKKKQKSKQSAETPKHKITLKELSVLSSVIAKSTFDVPAVILTTVRRAISLRKRCAKWFFASTESSSANQTHSHFITVLEELCELLERKLGKRTLGTHLKSIEDASHEQVLSTLSNNSFAALSLEEATELEATEVSTAEVSRIEIDEEEDDMESPYASMLIFSFFCLFEDLHNMRNFVSQSVTEYLEGKIDLMNVSVVADTAVQLSKQLIDEVLQAWPDEDLKKDQSLQNLMCMTASAFRGKDWFDKPDPTIPFNIEMGDVADWCYFPTSVLLASFRGVLNDNDTPVFRKGYFGIYDANARRERMSASQRFHEDKIILLELLPEFAFMQRIKVDLPVQDEITRGLINFVKDKKVPVWLCFATQILLDVHHGLRHSGSKAFNDLRLTALRTGKTIEEYWDLSKTFVNKPGFWPKQGEEVIKDVHTSIKSWVTEDALYELKRLSLTKKQLTTTNLQKNYFMKSHGILCGLVMFNFTLQMQRIGLSLINQWYDVVQLAYLYNVIQQTGVKGLRWPDMDLFIGIHGEERMFIGGRPKTANESLKKLYMATGATDVSNFARDSRNPGLGSRPNGKARLMESNAVVANMFEARYLENGQSKFSVDNVDKLLKEISPKGSKRNGDASTTSDLQLMHDRWESMHRLGALQLLAALKQGLYTEEPQLQFNYFGMHKRCIEILRRIQTKENHKFEQYYTSRYMPDDTLISNLVILILNVARNSGMASQMMGIGSVSGTSQVSRMILSCEDVMYEYLKTNGDKNCKELKAFCKNKSLGDARGIEVESKQYGYWFSMEEVFNPADMASLETGIPSA